MLSDFDTEGKNKLQKAVYYLKNYGMSYKKKKALRKFGIQVSEESEYMTWCRRKTVWHSIIRPFIFCCRFGRRRGYRSVLLEKTDL